MGREVRAAASRDSWPNENLGGLVRKTATVASETEGAPSVEETKTDDTAESPESSESPESKDPKDSA